MSPVRYIPRGLAIVFGLLFLVTLSYSLRTTLELSRTFSAVEGETADRTYHVGLYLPDTPSQFFDLLVEGARDAADEHGVALRVHRMSEAASEMRVARYSGLDGAILYPVADQSQLRPRFNALHEAGIPLVLVEHGVPDDWPWPLVGTNNFDVGRRIGELLTAMDDEAPRILLVYSDKSPGIASEQDLVELGIHSVASGDLETPIMREHTGRNPLDAEAMTYNVVRTRPQVNTIVFTDTADTLAAVQVIIDLNLVGSVRLIGFGMNATIQEYLDRGILAGTIVVNPRQIGFDSVRVLSGLIRDGLSPGYVDTGVELVRGAL